MTSAIIVFAYSILLLMSLGTVVASLATGAFFARDIGTQLGVGGFVCGAAAAVLSVPQVPGPLPSWGLWFAAALLLALLNALLAVATADGERYR